MHDRVSFKLRCLCLEATRVFGRTPAWRPIRVSVRCRGAVGAKENRERRLRTEARIRLQLCRDAVRIASHRGGDMDVGAPTPTPSRSPVTEYVALALSPSCAPVIKYVAPAPDVTNAAPAPADTRATPAAVTNVAPAPVIECIAPARVVPCLQLPPANTMGTVTARVNLDISGLGNPQFSTISVEASAPKLCWLNSPFGSMCCARQSGISGTNCCRGDDTQHCEIPTCPGTGESAGNSRGESEIGDIPVPPIVEETVGVVQIVPHERPLQRTDVPAMEHIAPAPPVPNSLPSQPLPPAYTMDTTDVASPRCSTAAVEARALRSSLKLATLASTSVGNRAKSSTILYPWEQRGRCESGRWMQRSDFTASERRHDAKRRRL